MNIELTIEELKELRIALSKATLSNNIVAMINKVDDMLKQNEYKYEYKALPRTKYQKTTHYESVIVRL